jgi:hypothetical protein
VWFGGKVLDGLLDVLDEHLAVDRRDSGHRPAAIGCVPWMGNDDVVNRLLQMRSCIVVDKEHVDIVPDRFIRSERGMPNNVLHMGRYRPDDIDPEEDEMIRVGLEHEYVYDVGPVRVYGWIKQPRVSKPLTHTKLLVLGELQWWTLYPDGAPEFEELHFVPQQVWCGSANWTNNSSLHLEMGLVCNDKGLLYEATDYLGTLIMQSELTTSGCAGPEPSFVYVDYPEPDADQIAEYLESEAEPRAEAEETDDEDDTAPPKE